MGVCGRGRVPCRLAKMRGGQIIGAKTWQAKLLKALNFGVWRRTLFARRTGSGGGRTSPSASGPRFAKTTRRTASAGPISPMTTRAAGPTAGAKTGCWASPTASAGCASPSALWNTHDPFLKERLFGLTGPQGNHGEDVKECYYYLDSTPTHSYMRALYQYPQGRFPYEALVEENRRRSRQEPEYELADTGVFAEQSLLRRVRRVRQGFAQRPADLDHGRQPGAGEGGLAPAAHAVVPQHVDLGLRSRRMLDEAPHPAGQGQHAADGARHPGPLPSCGRCGVGRHRLRLAFHRQCDQHASGSTACRTSGRTSRTPFTGTWSTARPRRSIRDASAPRSAAHYRLEIPARAEVQIRLRLFAEAESPEEVFGEAFSRVMAERKAGERRVLRPDHPGRTGTAGATDRPAGLRGAAVDEAVLPLRRGRLAQGRSQLSPAARVAQRRAQRGLAPPVQPRRALRARQVGVPLVCRLGPGLSHDPLGPAGPRVRQGPAHALAARVVHASQRADPGLRIRPGRRQSAGPRLGLLAGLQDDRAPRRARSGVSFPARSRSS